jgi:antitoxin component HigA of HigAB toxin-antitoxin module
MKPELSNSALLELEAMMEELKAYESHGFDRFFWLTNRIAHSAKLKMKGQNLQLKELAQIMGKKPAEVSRMLNGMHNMTLKSIASLETALGGFLLNVEGFENEYLRLEELDRNNSELAPQFMGQAPSDFDSWNKNYDRNTDSNPFSRIRNIKDNMFSNDEMSEPYSIAS